MDYVMFAILVLVALIPSMVYQVQRRQARAERKLNALLRHLKIDEALGQALSERVQDLARDPAKKIEAITEYRLETGADLAEAKEAVEAFTKSK